MKSTGELTDYYYNTLQGDLLELEKERKKLKNKISIRILFVTLLGIGVIILLEQSVHIDFNGLIFIGFIVFGVSTYIYKNSIKDYTLDFKLRIIAPLIKAIDENLQYRASSHLSPHLFKQSKLFNQDVDRYSGNDLVSGSIDGIHLQFSDVLAESETKDSKGNRRYNTIFQGLFIVADFNKHFNGVTLVLPDSAEKTFGTLIGTWLQSHNSRYGQLMKMDDPEFEKYFVVYGSDPVEARYLLTPSMMKRIIDFAKRSQEELYISFTSEKISIAIAYNKDLFEPSIFSSLLDYKSAMEYIKTLHLAIGIIQELKLNQKLWSKQ